MAHAFVSSEYMSMAKDAPDYERNCLGEIKTEVLYLPLSECNLIFLDKDGNPILPGYQQGEVFTCMDEDYIRGNGFLVEHPLIDTTMVARCSLDLDYENRGIALLRVDLRVKKPEPQDEDEA